MFEPGDRIRLRADEDEGWEAEEGTVMGMSGDTTWIVLVDPEYLTGPEDDGLREVTDDQMEEL